MKTEERQKTKATQHTHQEQRGQKVPESNPSGLKGQGHLDEQDKYITKGEFRRGLENFEKNLDLKLKTFKAEITTVFTEKASQVEKIFTEKVGQVEKTFTEKVGQMEKTFTEKVGQVEKTFTEKVGQIEERFFKYTFIAVGVILGGVGLMQYVANGNGSRQPIIIYTTPQQQVDASKQGTVSYVIPGQAVDQEKQNLESIVTSSKQENQPFKQNDKDSKSKGKTN